MNLVDLRLYIHFASGALKPLALGALRTPRTECTLRLLHSRRDDDSLLRRYERHALAHQPQELICRIEVCDCLRFERTLLRGLCFVDQPFIQRILGALQSRQAVRNEPDKRTIVRQGGTFLRKEAVPLAEVPVCRPVCGGAFGGGIRLLGNLLEECLGYGTQLSNAICTAIEEMCEENLNFFEERRECPHLRAPVRIVDRRNEHAIGFLREWFQLRLFQRFDILPGTRIGPFTHATLGVDQIPDRINAPLSTHCARVGHARRLAAQLFAALFRKLLRELRVLLAEVREAIAAVSELLEKNPFAVDGGERVAEQIFRHAAAVTLDDRRVRHKLERRVPFIHELVGALLQRFDARLTRDRLVLLQGHELLLNGLPPLVER